MKFQDIFFYLVLFTLFYFRRVNWFVYAGLLCILFSIPLFATWTFFTAERLTWYAAAFFLSAVLSHVFKGK